MIFSRDSAQKNKKQTTIDKGDLDFISPGHEKILVT